MKIKEVKEPLYSFDKSRPYYRLGRGMGQTAYVDPTPCFPHDKKVVTETAVKVTKILDFDATLYITHREDDRHTNGWATTNYHSYATGNWKWEPLILLSGKRTPIHPAVTRYMVAHEYGHCVQYCLEREMGLESGELLEPYGKMRKVKRQKHYGPKTWHKCVNEVFANDFRILAHDVEPEFWPHPFEFPKKESIYGEWWSEILDGNWVAP